MDYIQYKIDYTSKTITFYNINAYCPPDYFWDIVTDISNYLSDTGVVEGNDDKREIKVIFNKYLNKVKVKQIITSYLTEVHLTEL